MTRMMNDEMGSRTGLRGVDHDFVMILRRSNPLPMKMQNRMLDALASNMHTKC